MDNFEIDCHSIDFRKHIAFDTHQMELPIRCDLCVQQSTHFCVIHRGIYCINHISNHEGFPSNQFIESLDGEKLKKEFGVLIDSKSLFSDEDIELVCKQAGVGREKAKNALIEAKGDLSRAILLLTTE
jgi:predicted metal-binding transcription factor (methanogenesis marker protein 9)